ALVYGAHAGEGASQAAASMSDSFTAPPIGNPRVESGTMQSMVGEPLNLADIRNALKSLMWRSVGVLRDAGGLAEALQNVNHWCGYVLGRQFDTPGGWELENMLCVARLMIEAAAARTETRGAHVRTDFPAADPLWDRHRTFRREESIV
ncbi:MAG: L-aspartate oxidase, partial [Candidatus Aminicenantales bacterium]